MDYSLDDSQVPHHRYGSIGAFVIVALFGIALFVILNGSDSRTMISVRVPPGTNHVVSIDGEDLSAVSGAGQGIYSARVRTGPHVVGLRAEAGTTRTTPVVIASRESVVVFAVVGDSLQLLTRF